MKYVHPVARLPGEPSGREDGEGERAVFLDGSGTCLGANGNGELTADSSSGSSTTPGPLLPDTSCDLPDHPGDRTHVSRPSISSLQLTGPFWRTKKVYPYSCEYVRCISISCSSPRMIIWASALPANVSFRAGRFLASGV